VPLWWVQGEALVAISEGFLAQYEHLPIYKAAFDLLIYFEKIVTHFSRYHKYTHGTALRSPTREILTLIIRANNNYDGLHEVPPPYG
jgi:hypothetical protein